MTFESFKLFSKERGDVGNYRIPAIIVTNSGVVVACADARHFTAGDNPNRIDKVICRSTDSGKTWSDIQYVVKEVGEVKQYSSAAIDPALAYDSEKNILFMLYSHTPAGIGILNNKRGTGFDKNGDLIVKHKSTKYALKADGYLYQAGKKTEYTVNKNYDVMKGSQKVGNIKTLEGGFTEHRTSYMYIVKSYDEGLTWTEPECISKQVKEEYMAFFGCGPGIGVQIKEGKYKGRIVVPVYFTPRVFPLMECAACIYSDDHGVTWNKGGVMGDNRKRCCGLFKVGHKFILDGERTSETQIVLMKDGSIKAFIRNHNKIKRVATAVSHDGGVTWEDFKYLDIPQCICQISAINAKDQDKDVVLVLNAASETKRENGVIRISYDEGNTFKHSLQIHDGEFVYSSMCQMPDGNIGILYEASTQHETVDFMIVSIDDIKKGSV